MTLSSYAAERGWDQRDDGSFLNMADYWSQVRSPFSELVTVPLTNDFSLTANYGLSALRDVFSSSGSGSVTHTGSEFKLATAAVASDDAELRSAQSGLYKSGYGAEAGVAIRLSAAPTGEQVAEWGLLRGDNAMVFGQDATGVYIRINNGGTETKKYQPDWNGDTLDGDDDSANPSDFVLDTTKIHVYQVRFTYYGAGPINFNIAMVDSDGRQHLVTVHRYSDTSAPSIRNPNLPVVVKIDNGATATALSAFVTGRKYGIIGPRDPKRRITGELRSGVSVGTSALVPLISFRRKADVTDGAFFESVSVKLDTIQAITDNDIELVLLNDADLTAGTSPSWGALTRVTASETALEVDTTATALTGGEYVTSAIMKGGQGNQEALGSFDPLDFDLIERQPITLAAIALSSTASVTALLRMREEW